jgi:transposase
MFVVCLSRMRGNRASPGSEGAWRQQCLPATRRLQKLHTLGLLSASFRPDSEMCALRSYLRHRAPHIAHMQKALQQMNIQLPQVISDLMGETGMAIIRAILAGERDEVKLAQLRHPGCQSSEETIAKALIGTWKDEHLFALQQSWPCTIFTHNRWRLAINKSSSTIRP